MCVCECVRERNETEGKEILKFISVCNTRIVENINYLWANIKRSQTGNRREGCLPAVIMCDPSR